MLYMVRHGQSTANAEGKWCGLLDVPLTAVGLRQARACGSELAHIAFHAVFTSKLGRAIETTNIILAANSNPLPEIQEREALNERSDGELSGYPYHHHMNQFPRRKWMEWERDCYTKPPGGESIEEVSKRVMPVFEGEIMPLVNQRKDVLVVSHSNPMKLMIGAVRGVPLEEVLAIEVQNGVPYLFKPRA